MKAGSIRFPPPLFTQPAHSGISLGLRMTLEQLPKRLQMKLRGSRQSYPNIRKKLSVY